MGNTGEGIVVTLRACDVEKPWKRNKVKNKMFLPDFSRLKKRISRLERKLELEYDGLLSVQWF